MDLWVRSQDRKRLTKVEDLYLVHDSNNFCDYIGNNIVGHLAKYTKKGRALEVLDEIQDYLINLDKAVIYSMTPLDDYLNVYQMPKE